MTDVIQKHGVSPEDPIYKSCIQKLFKVTKIFVMVSLMTLTLYCTVGQGALIRNLKCIVWRVLYFQVGFLFFSMFSIFNVTFLFHC